MLKTGDIDIIAIHAAYHLGEGRVLKTLSSRVGVPFLAYHLGEGRVLKTCCS